MCTLQWPELGDNFLVYLTDKLMSLMMAPFLSCHTRDQRQKGVMLSKRDSSQRTVTTKIFLYGGEFNQKVLRHKQKCVKCVH